jgi:hypothetical protein
MTYKTITGSYPSGYVLRAKYNGLNIAASASVGGGGVVTTAFDHVYNGGAVHASIKPGYNGVNLEAGGFLANATGRHIYGGTGVLTSAAASYVSNYGSIGGYRDAVRVDAGGTVINDASIVGGANGVNAFGGSGYVYVFNNGFIGVESRGTVAANAGVVLESGAVTNYGSIAGSLYGVVGYEPITVTNRGLITGYSSVVLHAGGSVVNFSDIDGVGEGVFADGGSVGNLGVIEGSLEQGVLLFDAELTNGSTAVNTALVTGYVGVEAVAGSSILNYGTINAPSEKSAVYLSQSTLTNGSTKDTAALVYGFIGVSVVNGGTVDNLGAIQSPSDDGYAIQMSDGGEVTNGSSRGLKAEIVGAGGIFIYGAAGTVTNFATIESDGSSDPVFLADGGRVVNGSASDKTAVIKGPDGGVAMDGAGLVTNFGTIGSTGSSTYGAYLFDADLTNGSAIDQTALIYGRTGVLTYGAVTVTNWGEIDGEFGSAVNFTGAGDRLVVEAGSSFVGDIFGDAGTLELASGVGTITGMVEDEVTVTGSMPGTTFDEFGTLIIADGASFKLTGAGSVVASGIATLDVLGAMSVTGTLDVSGAIKGTGSLSLTGGTTTFDTGADLAISKIGENGVKAVADVADKSLVDRETWTQTAGTLSVASGDRIVFEGAGDSFSGTLAGAGKVEFYGGGDTLSGATLTAAVVEIDKAAVTLSGAIDLTSLLDITSPGVVVAAAGATLSGKGKISLSDETTNVIKGASAAATLTNFDDKIVGAGDLGDGAMKLVNDAGGTIEAYLPKALTINLGANTLVNAGLILNTDTGGLVIDGAVDNTGTLEATKGTLKVGGAVSGAGKVTIAGGTVQFGSAFAENVTFTSATGSRLVLADATSYAGKISGFSKTGASSLDLEDIAFSGAKVSYKGTATSGVLTVTSGADKATITLEGDYLTSTFTLSKAAGGGTIVTDPSAPPLQPLVSAMAAFGAPSAGGSASHAQATWRAPVLARPGGA